MWNSFNTPHPPPPRLFLRKKYLNKDPRWWYYLFQNLWISEVFLMLKLGLAFSSVATDVNCAYSRPIGEVWLTHFSWFRGRPWRLRLLSGSSLISHQGLTSFGCKNIYRNGRSCFSSAVRRKDCGLIQAQGGNLCLFVFAFSLLSWEEKQQQLYVVKS